VGNLDVIKANSASVVSNGPSGSVELWTAQSLISQPGVEPRVYSSLFDIYGLQTQIRQSQIYDNDKQNYKLFKVSSFRVSTQTSLTGDAPAPTLYIGDQVVDTNGIYWQVLGIQSEGPGTRAYSIGYEVGAIAGPDRHGGL
jgi:hypothetical protein